MSKERFHEIVKEMVDLHDRKNRDYAGGDYLSNSNLGKPLVLPVRLEKV